MISLNLLLEHMAWANQEIYKEVKKLDSKVLDYFVIDPEWTVRTIMIHIAGASHLYGQRLNGEPFSRFELKSNDDSEIIDELLIELNRIDQSLMKNVDRVAVTLATCLSKIPGGVGPPSWTASWASSWTASCTWAPS